MYPTAAYECPKYYAVIVQSAVFSVTIQRHPGDAKCVTEVLGDKNKEVWGTNLPFCFKGK